MRKFRVLVLSSCLMLSAAIARADGNMESPGITNPPPVAQTHIPDIVTILLSLFGHP